MTTTLASPPKTRLFQLLVSDLAPLLGALHVGVASVLDRDGRLLLEDCVVIHDAEAPAGSSVTLNSVAVVVECHEFLELDMLPALYERTLALKMAGIERAAATPAHAYDMTTTVVLARDAASTLDEIAAAMADSTPPRRRNNGRT